MIQNAVNSSPDVYGLYVKTEHEKNFNSLASFDGNSIKNSLSPVYSPQMSIFKTDILRNDAQCSLEQRNFLSSPSRFQESQSNVAHGSLEVNPTITCFKQKPNKQTAEESNFGNLIDHSDYDTNNYAAPKNACYSADSELEFNIRSENTDKGGAPGKVVNHQAESYFKKDENCCTQKPSLKLGLPFNASLVPLVECHTNNNSSVYAQKTFLSAADMTNELSEKESGGSAHDAIDAVVSESISYLNLPARVTDKSSESLSLKKSEGQKLSKERRNRSFEKDISRIPITSQTPLNKLTGAKNSVEQHGSAFLTTSLSFMSPQDQSLLATPESGCSPGHGMTSPPASGAKIPRTTFEKVDDQYTNSCESSEGESLEMQMQSQFNYQRSFNANDCRNDERENFETKFEEENGGKDGQRKVSSDTIYPWMKESRQHQKKKSSASISSGNFNNS